MKFDCPVELNEDKWLTELMGSATYKLVVNDCILDAAGEAAFEESPQGGAWAYSKIATTDLRSLNYILSKGFFLVETATLFRKPVSQEKPVSVQGVRFALDDDEDQVRDIALHSFSHSRFHVDPFIDDSLANKIKENWVGNFFTGERGTHMVVAHHEGEIAGFLLLIVSSSDVVIDLIAVSSKYRKMGYAKKMILFAENQFRDCDVVRVGTQIDNAESIALYTSLGFAFDEASYVVHYHSK